MRMVDLIEKKKRGMALSGGEIDYIVDGFTKGEIPDYQMSAFLMAVCFQNMNTEETVCLTQAMTRSGETVDLKKINGVKVDKHSTGGVGDKTTLIAAPIAAACGVKVAKMSGRGLGHTGGTIDKLESIPGFRTAVGREDFIRIVNEKGLCVIGQSGNLAPADKKIYALRDVTATVDKLPLIASSIMSKKLAAGSDCILLDVKTGSGAFMKSFEDSVKLAQTMVEIGNRAGKATAALITGMDVPLGRAVGNSLEVIEAAETLLGSGPEDLRTVCLELAAGMLSLAGFGGREKCLAMAENAVESGEAFKRLCAMVKAQGGDPECLTDYNLFAKAGCERELRAEKDGYIAAMDTQACGVASMLLGAGRETKESVIDPAAGLLIEAKTGDFVRRGGLIARLYTNKPETLDNAEKMYRGALTWADNPPVPQPLIYARVDQSGVEMLR